MSSKNAVKTNQDLLNHLMTCPPHARIRLMPEEGDGLDISGVIELNNKEGRPEVWLLIDEFTDGSEDDDEDDVVWVNPRLGTVTELTPDPAPEEKPDVIQVRGLLKSA